MKMMMWTSGAYLRRAVVLFGVLSMIGCGEGSGGAGISAAPEGAGAPEDRTGKGPSEAPIKRKPPQTKGAAPSGV